MKNLSKLSVGLLLMALIGCSGEGPTPTGPTIGGGTGGDNTTTTGVGTRENPFTVADVIAKASADAGPYWVKGYIVGQVPGKALAETEFAEPFTPSAQDDGTLNTYNTNVVIAEAADVADYNNCVPVQLPSGPVRTGLNLPENGQMLGQEVLLYGNLEAYFGVAGVKAVLYAEVNGQKFGMDPDDQLTEPQDGEPGSLAVPFTLEQANQYQGAKDNGVKVWVEAYIVGYVGGMNFSGAVMGATGEVSGTNILVAATADETDVTKTMPVQLPNGAVRTALNLAAHPENIGKKVKLNGTLEPYFGVAGIKNVAKAYLDDKLVEDGALEKPTEMIKVTVAEFIKKPVSETVWYEITGTVANLNNTDYGNFDIVDETGSVYVYGLTKEPVSKNDKSFSSLGVKEGDNITLAGTRGEYNGKIEVMNAYLISKN